MIAMELVVVAITAAAATITNFNFILNYNNKDALS